MKEGEKVVKINSEKTDIHQDGSEGTVMNYEKMMDILLEDLPEKGKKELLETLPKLVFVYWDDMPEVPCAVAEWRLKLKE